MFNKEVCTYVGQPSDLVFDLDWSESELALPIYSFSGFPSLRHSIWRPKGMEMAAPDLYTPPGLIRWALDTLVHFMVPR